MRSLIVFFRSAFLQIKNCVRISLLKFGGNGKVFSENLFR
jgi:hypothetical protein